MNTTTPLTNNQQRGILSYSVNGLVCREQGWFHLEENTVIRRRIGSQRTFKLCSQDSVIDFELFTKAGK